MRRAHSTRAREGSLRVESNHERLDVDVHTLEEAIEHHNRRDTEGLGRVNRGDDDEGTNDTHSTSCP